MLRLISFVCVLNLALFSLTIVRDKLFRVFI